MTMVLVVGFVENGAYDGILAGNSRLKDWSSRITIGVVIALRM